MQKIFSGEKVTIWGDGGTKQDYLYVTDLAKFCRLAAESELTGIFNVGSGTGLTLIELARMIEEVSGKNLSIEYKAGRAFDVREIVLNIENARKLLNWNSGIALQDGLSLQFDWMLKQSENSAGRHNK